MAAVAEAPPVKAAHRVKVDDQHDRPDQTESCRDLQLFFARENFGPHDHRRVIGDGFSLGCIQFIKWISASCPSKPSIKYRIGALAIQYSARFMISIYCQLAWQEAKIGNQRIGVTTDTTEGIELYPVVFRMPVATWAFKVMYSCR